MESRSNISKTKFASFEEMKNSFPKTVYKYRRWNNKYDKRVITHGELYLASPRTFEDKKDCKQTVRFEKLTREQKLSFLINIVKKEKEEKDKSWSEKTIEEIALKRYLSSKIRNEQTAKEFTDEMLNRYFDITGVLSVTKNQKNESMWLKYADNHKGFCIGFDSMKLFKNELIGSGSKVFYEKELPEIMPEPFMSINEQRIKQIYFKEQKWCFEDEYRLHKIMWPEFPEEDRKIYPSAEAFKEIIIGKDMPDEDFEELKAQIPERLSHIKIIRK